MTYICNIHEFSTDDVEKWDRHCYYTGHKQKTSHFIDGKWEYVIEPYPRHHLRDAIANGDVIMTTDVPLRMSDDESH